MSTSSSFTRLRELLPQLFQEPEFQGNPYLRFSLNAQLSALILMEKVKESLSVSAEKITPIPSLPSFVMGLMSSRDSVFLVVDLAQLIGLSPLSTYLRQYNVIVLDLSSFLDSSQNLLVGFAVNRIQGVNRFLPEQIAGGVNLNESLITKHLPKNSKEYFSSQCQGKDGELMILELSKIFRTLKH